MTRQHSSGLPLSPELVLVSSPESAELARRQLPDRPWEAFAPVRPSETSARAPLATQPPFVPVISMPGEATRYRPGRRTGRLALAAVAGAVALAFLPAREPATSTSALAGPAASVRAAESRLDVTRPKASPANGSAVASPTATGSPARRTSRHRVRTRQHTIVSRPPASTTTAGSVSRARATPVAPVDPSTKGSGQDEAAARALDEATAATGAIKGGGYVFGDGHFRVSDNGRYVIEFTLPACPGAVLPPIRIRADGGFSYTGPASGSGVVRLDGRFVTPQSANGTLRVGLRGCPPVQSDLSARLS